MVRKGQGERPAGGGNGKNWWESNEWQFLSNVNAINKQVLHMIGKRDHPDAHDPRRPVHMVS